MGNDPPRHSDPLHYNPARYDAPFLWALAILGGLYVFLILAMLLADVSYTSAGHLWAALASRDIQYSIKLSLISCSLTAIFSLWVAVPLGYLMSRYEFRGKRLVDVLIDIPIVLPPLVIGLSLLILFKTAPGQWIDTRLDALHERWRWVPNGIPFEVPAVILAQFSVAAAFAVRTMRVTFDQISPRTEQVALTLGCSRSQAFWLVVLPEARRGMITAGTLAWARALGEFGPILVFAGATRGNTEVLSTTVFLELSIGDLEAAVAVSLLMVAAAVVVLVIVRLYGMDPIGPHAKK
ncbi:MAG: ABC transporter permease [Gemmataceae bacterium]